MSTAARTELAARNAAFIRDVATAAARTLARPEVFAAHVPTLPMGAPAITTPEDEHATYQGADAYIRDFRTGWPRPRGAAPLNASHIDTILDEFDISRFLTEARNNAPECSTTPSDAGMRAVVYYLAKQVFELAQRYEQVTQAYADLANTVQPLVAMTDDLSALVGEQDTLPGCGSEG